MNRQASVTGFQYFALIVGVLMANGIFTLPRLVAQKGGRAGWVAIVIAGTVALFIAMAAELLARFFPDKDAASWATQLMGNVIGRVWSVLYLVRSLVFAVLTSRLYAGMLDARVLIHTPTSVLAVIVTLLAVAIAFTHMRGMARYAELALYLTLPILLLNLLPVRAGHTFHLLPVLRDASLSSLAKAVPTAAYSFAGLDIIWFAYPYLQNKKASRVVVSASIAFVTAAYASVSAAALMVFGLERLLVTNFPPAANLALIEAVLLERLDSIAFFVWLSTVALTAAAQVYIAARLGEELVPRATFNRCAAFFSGLIIVASVGEYPVRYALKASDLFGSVDLVFIGGSAILLPLAAYIKTRRKEKRAAA